MALVGRLRRSSTRLASRCSAFCASSSVRELVRFAARRRGSDGPRKFSEGNRKAKASLSECPRSSANPWRCCDELVTSQAVKVGSSGADRLSTTPATAGDALIVASRVRSRTATCDSLSSPMRSTSPVIAIIRGPTTSSRR